MRPLAALAISVGIVLLVHSYLRLAAGLRDRPGSEVQEVAAAGTYAVEITLTFDAQADEFALEPISLLLRRQQAELVKREGLVAAGEPIVVDPIEGIIEGPNEFYFECIPKEAEEARSRAVRLRVLRDGVPVADQTYWAPPGQTPRGVLALDVPRSKRPSTPALP